MFLERLQSEAIPPLPHAHIVHLGSVYTIAHTPNAELRLRFYQIALRDPRSSAAREYAPAAVHWVVGAEEGDRGGVKGRMKFCRPVWRLVGDVDRGLAVGMYLKYREAFHPIAQRLIEKVCVGVMFRGGAERGLGFGDIRRGGVGAEDARRWKRCQIIERWRVRCTM